MTPFVQTLFFLINLALMTFLAVVSGFGIAASMNTDNRSMLYLAVYLLIFATFGFFHDLTAACKVDSFYKTNFPFLDSALGKGLFLIFIGALTFGLPVPEVLVIAAGASIVAWGGLQVLLWLAQPQYFQLP